jgi:hypothetical protein
MRIVQSPYQARIVPQSAGAPNLWRCVIEQEGSREVVVLHETARKEDARCIALLELARLEPTAQRLDGLPVASNRRSSGIGARGLHSILDLPPHNL